MFQIIIGFLAIFFILYLFAAFPKLMTCLVVFIVGTLILGLLWRIGLLGFIVNIFLRIFQFLFKQVAKLIAKFGDGEVEEVEEEILSYFSEYKILDFMA